MVMFCFAFANSYCSISLDEMSVEFFTKYMISFVESARKIQTQYDQDASIQLQNLKSKSISVSFQSST